MKKIIPFLTLASALSFTVLAGAAETATEAQEVTTLRVANAAMPKPYSFLDDNNEVTGYDIEVITAVIDALPQYEMELTVTEFPSILAGIDSGRYDVAINCLKSTEERKEKYIFTDPYLVDRSVMIVAADNTDINSLADLKGKETVEVTGTVGGQTMENYSEREDMDITVNYSEADYSVLLQQLSDGKYDFMYLNKLTYDQLNEERNYNLRTFFLTDEDYAAYTDGADTESTYILLPNTEEGQKIADDFNGAIKELIENGTLDELAEKYFGSTEYVPSVE